MQITFLVCIRTTLESFGLLSLAIIHLARRYTSSCRYLWLETDAGLLSQKRRQVDMAQLFSHAKWFHYQAITYFWLCINHENEKRFDGLFKSLCTCGAILCHRPWSSLVLLMACRSFGAMPLTKQVLTECQCKRSTLYWNLNATTASVQYNAFENALYKISDIILRFSTWNFDSFIYILLSHFLIGSIWISTSNYVPTIYTQCKLWKGWDSFKGFTIPNA